MKKNKSKNVWKDLDIGSIGNEQFAITATSLGLGTLLKNCLDTDGFLTEFSSEGNIKQIAESEDEPIVSVTEKFSTLFSDRGGKLVYRYLNNGSGNGNTSVYLWDDGIIELSTSHNWVSVHGISKNEAFMKEIKNYLSTQWAPVEKLGHIYAIVRQGPHLGLSSIGNAGIPLVKINYTPKVMEDYKFIIKDLNSESPSGRLAIMRGPAGTGKTHLIRAMLLEVPDAMFVLISPDIVTNLAGPELLPLLMNYRGGLSGPIILVLEDADKCLVARDSTDMNSIQALLNLGDGILGSLLDIRIVATTNADEFKMDAAITRPGRLSKMIDVNSLDPTTAANIFSNLLPKEKVPAEISDVKPNLFKMTLAEVYALARKYGWAPAPRKSVKEENEDSDDDEDIFNDSDE